MRPTSLVIRRKDLTLLASGDEATPTRDCREETLDDELSQRLNSTTEPSESLAETTAEMASGVAPAVTEAVPEEVPPAEESPSPPEQTAPVIVLTEPNAQSAQEQKTEQKPARPPRDFIVAFNGIFIGHYHSARWISNQAAFKVVARALQQGLEEPLDLSLLDLYKPTPMKFRKPDAIDGVGDGTFSWFGVED